MKQLLNGIILAGIALVLTGSIYQPGKTIIVPATPQSPAAVSSASYDAPEPKPVVTQSVPTQTSNNTSQNENSNVAQSSAAAAAPIPSGSHEDWMAAAGISPSDYGYVDYIISHESGWNPNATEPTFGAHGLPQALPYSKTGCGWVDAVCQLQWANGYAVSRYGSWAAAYVYWTIHHNW